MSDLASATPSGPIPVPYKESMNLVWAPDDLRQAGRQVLVLADRLKTDPSTRQVVVTKTVAEIRAVAAKMRGLAADALATAADDIDAAIATITAAQLSWCGRAMINAGDKHAHTERDIAARF